MTVIKVKCYWLILPGQESTIQNFFFCVIYIRHQTISSRYGDYYNVRNIKLKILNIAFNKIKLYLVGMPLPSKNALRIKVGLMPHHKLVCKADNDNSDDDSTWKPCKGKSTKPNMQSSLFC